MFLIQHIKGNKIAKKKKKKSKAQKRFEKSKRTLDFISPDKHPTRKKADFHKLTQDLLNHMNEYSDSKSKVEMQKDVEKYVGICTLAWNLSITGKTYEKSIEELNSLALNDEDLLARMSMKFALVHALRLLFSLPADKESSFQAAVEILTPEELNYFYEANGLGKDETHPFLNRSYCEFTQDFFDLN